MIHLSASADYGLTGQYVARITGRHSKYTFEREFLGRKGGKRMERTEADVDTAGLYEECGVDKKAGKVSAYWVTLDGDEARRVDKETAMKVAAALGEGRAIADVIAFVGEGHEVQLLTKAQAEAAKAATNITDAVAACVVALGALPAPMQRRALAELRKRLFPAAAEAPAAEPAAAEPGGAPHE